jgi:predicted TIM-barrel fold metal-dependent hydrolase
MADDRRSMLLEEWKAVGAVDHHCHPLRRWPFQLTPVELRSAFTEAIDPELAEKQVIHTAAYHAAIRLIAAELECEPAEKAILERRNGGDPGGYARHLFAATNTEVMLVDAGFASADAFTLDEQQRALGIPQREIVRLETLAESLVKSVSDPRDWFAATRQKLQQGVEQGAVGVKTICAYRASLRLRPVDTDALGVAFTALKLRADRGEILRLTGNALCHALLFEAALECQALDIPLQVHCGFGDPDEDLAETSPLGLRPLFVDSAYRGLQITLLHCYPYHRAAAYLCSVFANVYMDLSLAIPFAALDGARAMKEALGLCPFTKLLYASDATRYPEVYLVAATLHRQALAEALAELIDRNVLSMPDAITAGRQVLVENARQLYRLA